MQSHVTGHIGYFWVLNIRDDEVVSVFVSHSDARYDEGPVLLSAQTTLDNTTLQICLQRAEWYMFSGFVGPLVLFAAIHLPHHNVRAATGDT